MVDCQPHEASGLLAWRNDKRSIIHPFANLGCNHSRSFARLI